MSGITQRAKTSQRIPLLFVAVTALVSASVIAFPAAAQQPPGRVCEVVDFNGFQHGDPIEVLSLFGGSLTLTVEAVRNNPAGPVDATAYDTELWDTAGNPPPNSSHDDTQRNILCNPASNGGIGECDGIMLVVPDTNFQLNGDDTQGGFVTISGFSGTFEIPSYAAVDSDDTNHDILLRVGPGLVQVGTSTGQGNATVETVVTDDHTFTGQAEFEFEGSGGVDDIEICRPDEVVEGGCVVIIDEEGVDNDMRSVERAAGACGVKPDDLVNDQGIGSPLPANSVCQSSGLDSSDQLPVECGNPPLLWNQRVEAGLCGASQDEAGRLALLPTGQVDDEGWFAPPAPGTDGGIRYSDQRPSTCNTYTSGAVDADGNTGYERWLADFVAGIVPKECLDKVRDVVPLRNQDLVQLVGKTCVAVVYDSDISSNTQPLDANLQGRRYGLFTFKVEAIEVPGSLPESGSSTSLYDMWLRILPPQEPTTPLRVKIHDHEPDSVQVTQATFSTSTRVLTVKGTSNYPGNDNTPPYLEDPSSAVNDPDSVYNTPLLPTPDPNGDNFAYMTVSVDNPADNDAAADPAVDPLIREVRMLRVSENRYRADITVPAAAGDLRGRRLVIQTDEGGAYNVIIK